MYHAEEAQENFLVLAGEFLLIVEGEERLLRASDFVPTLRSGPNTSSWGPAAARVWSSA